MSKGKQKWEYGDFQTPPSLASAAIGALVRLGVKPKSVVEPTCGKGSFLQAAMLGFPNARRFVGIDVNGRYLEALSNEIQSSDRENIVQLIRGDFFLLNWDAILDELPLPVLIVGNPPWVTSAELGALESANIPTKSNFQQRRGYDAITGKSNFDISEWMLLQHLEWMKTRRGAIGVLCKTAVARKVLSHAWKHTSRISGAKMFMIDVKKHFNASVDACFLVIDMLGERGGTDCLVYEDLSAEKPSRVIGYHDGIILSDVEHYLTWRHLNGVERAYVWRSGIKHDCSKVMEFEAEGDKFRNGLNELVALEDDYVYPMLKSSDIGNGETRYGRKWMLVTQQYVGEDTKAIRRSAPRVWRYLEGHGDVLDSRGSLIYRKQPRFAIFGVGEYSFSGWKVAISGFYKRLAFKLIEPYQGKTVVLDDTNNFLPCWSEAEAKFVVSLVNSKPAQEFLESMIFWSDKRPITIEILKRLDLHALSRELGCEEEYQKFARRRRDREMEETHGQLALGIAQRTGKYSVNKKIGYSRSVVATRQKIVRR